MFSFRVAGLPAIIAAFNASGEILPLTEYGE